MKRVHVLALLPLCGCAAIIGASFDDAGLAIDASDASSDGITFPEANADVIAPQFNPNSISGLQFWIDATRGVTTGDGGVVVTQWKDFAPSPHDAVPNAATNAPTLVPNALNGLPVVHFNSAQVDLLQSSLTGPSTGNLTLFVVSRGYPESAIRFQSTAGNYPFLIFPYDLAQDASAPSWSALVGIPAQTFTTIRAGLDGGPSVVAMTWNTNGTAATYDNGVLVEQLIDLNPQLAGGQTLNIGGVLPLLAAPYTSTPFMNGDLAEALIYGAALDDADRHAVEGYLKAKWGIFP